ncbi:MAG: hypothetical protein Kow00104_07630 [Rhodothalassiaceae bacterium]
MNRLAGRKKAETVWADGEAGKEIAEDRAALDPVEHKGSEQAGDQDQEDIGEPPVRRDAGCAHRGGFGQMKGHAFQFLPKLPICLA